MTFCQFRGNVERICGIDINFKPWRFFKVTPDFFFKSCASLFSLGNIADGKLVLSLRIVNPAFYLIWFYFLFISCKFCGFVAQSITVESVEVFKSWRFVFFFLEILKLLLKKCQIISFECLRHNAPQNWPIFINYSITWPLLLPFKKKNVQVQYLLVL